MNATDTTCRCGGTLVITRYGERQLVPRPGGGVRPWTNNMPGTVLIRCDRCGDWDTKPAA
jgi:hypothetical protein